VGAPSTSANTVSTSMVNGNLPVATGANTLGDSAIPAPSGNIVLATGKVFGIGATGTADTGLSRDSAGVVDMGNGTAGNKSGSLNLTNLTVTGTCTGCGGGTFSSLTGDATSTSTGGATEVVGLLNHVLPSLATGYLNWTGSAWALSAAGGMVYPGAGVAISSGSAWSTSMPLAGGGDYVVTGPGGGVVNNDLVSYSGTAGTIQDSGILASQVVKASSPVAGVAHFAGSTQTVTSSAVSLTADVSGILPAANGGTAVANTASLTLGTSNQNWATLGTGIVKNTTTTGAISDAVASDVYGLWSGTCSSSTFLRGDGACAAPSGSGTVSAAAQYDVAYYTQSGTTAQVGGAAIAGFQFDSTSGAPVAATATNLGTLANIAQYNLAVSGGTSAALAGIAPGALGTFLSGQGASANPSYVALSAINPQTATYQVLAADFSSYKTITVASGTFTITLVASGSQPAAGQYVNIVNYGTGAVTIARSGQNINGGTTSLVLSAGSALAPTSARVWSDGTNYFAAMEQIPAPVYVGPCSSGLSTSWLCIQNSALTLNTQNYAIYQTNSGNTDIGGTSSLNFDISGAAATFVTSSGMQVVNNLQAKSYSTGSNCSSSASPAVCGSAAAGSVLIPTGTSSSTLTVNTTAVTANSQIFFYPDDSLGTKLSTTCNSTLATLAGGSFISARTAGTSFTITFNGSILTNGVCGSFFIVN